MSIPTDKLAFRVTIHGDLSCIAFAATNAAARWIAVRSYWQAYGRQREWPRTTAVRCPCYDRSPLRNEARAYSEEYVRK